MGQSLTVAVTPTTTITLGGKATPLSGLKPGYQATVRIYLANTTFAASHIIAQTS
jgi:hypothetical protein